MTDTPDQTRAATVDRYGILARAAWEGHQIADCGPDAFKEGRFGAAAYSDTSTLPEGAVRASLGCGNPLTVADLHPGDTVLDLGSGGGIDVLLSARRVAPNGIAYGLDASPDMLILALANAAEAGVTNVEFMYGHIEDIPLPDNHLDVVISNCVINLSTNKPRTLAEAFRVLKPGGRLGISDVIADPDSNPARRTQAEQHIGCTNGTLTAAQYEQILSATGYTDIHITPTTRAGQGLHSATVQATKPSPGASPVPPVSSRRVDKYDADILEHSGLGEHTG
jgi:SAM-dependent methyltransferase